MEYRPLVYSLQPSGATGVPQPGQPDLQVISPTFPDPTFVLSFPNAPVVASNGVAARLDDANDRFCRERLRHCLARSASIGCCRQTYGYCKKSNSK